MIILGVVINKSIFFNISQYYNIKSYVVGAYKDHLRVAKMSLVYAIKELTVMKRKQSLIKLGCYPCLPEYFLCTCRFVCF